MGFITLFLFLVSLYKETLPPVTGGNVSLYNESKNNTNDITPINPTPVIGMVGKIDNVEKAISSEWKNIDDQIWIIGSYKSETTIAASSYLEYFHGKITGRPPKICLLYTSPSPRDPVSSRMPSSA